MVELFGISIDFNAFLASVIAFLGTNIVTIVLFAVKYIKLKAKELKEKAQHNQIVEELKSEYDKKLSELYEKFIEKMDKVESHVVKKIAEQDLERQAEIKAETFKIEDAVKEVKKTLDIDDII